MADIVAFELTYGQKQNDFSYARTNLVNTRYEELNVLELASMDHNVGLPIRHYKAWIDENIVIIDDNAFNSSNSINTRYS